GATIRMAALRQTSGWRDLFTWSGGEDYDLWLQVVEAGWEVSWVRDAVYYYRQHEQSFLANANLATQVDVALNILSAHRSAIASAGLLEDFLRPQVMPAFYAVLRQRDVRRAARIARRLARSAPLAALRLAAGYYLGRLFARKAA
ncbi:MAG TPA: hypothetical protein VN605_14655, partial [Thermoanaerobaculia bacterium]|nr:hypothetical protein [Thermoanaerobaculia bacterium]